MSKSAIGDVLLLGSSGMLGRAWKQLLVDQQINFTAPPHNEFDITGPGLIPGSVKTVINCAAYTDVDGAESDEAGAQLVNGAAPGHLAEQCLKANATLVHYSTDYVFNGQATEPYPVDQAHDPVNAYGRSKATGETAIMQSGALHLIVRTSWLYAPWSRNFVGTIANLLRTRDQINVVNDQRGRPTSCTHLAAMTLALLERDCRGVYHVTDGGDCTWYDFACEIGKHIKGAGKVAPCTTDAFPRPAQRPAYSVLDLAKTEKAIGPMAGWQDNLAHVMKTMTESNT